MPPLQPSSTLDDNTASPLPRESGLVGKWRRAGTLEVQAHYPYAPTVFKTGPARLSGSLSVLFFSKNQHPYEAYQNLLYTQPLHHMRV